MLSEAELVKACLEGNSEARRALYDRYSSKLWVVCLRFARNRMIAQDLFQEGFIRIFENLSSYQGQGSFEGWLRRIMVNTSINYYKKHKRHLSDQDSNDTVPERWYDSDVIDTLSADELLEMVQSLPDSHRVVFNLFVLEGYSHKEIADLLGITENTSKSRMFRSRLMLQEIMERNNKESYLYEKQRRV